MRNDVWKLQETRWRVEPFVRYAGQVFAVVCGYAGTAALNRDGLRNNFPVVRT